MQCGKLNFWITRPKTAVPYMFYTNFHLPKPIFYSSSSKCTHIGERASISFPHWYVTILYYCHPISLFPLASHPKVSHVPMDKMAAISQTAFSNAFPWMEFLYFDLNLTKVSSYGFSLQEFSIGWGNGLVSNRHQAITWTNTDPIRWHIYSALGEMTVHCMGHH